MKPIKKQYDESIKILFGFLNYSGSIQAKIFITFSIVVFLSISIISYMLYINFSQTIEDNAVSYVADAVKNANHNFEIIFDDIEKISTALVINQSSIINPLTSTFDQITYEGFREQQDVKDLLNSVL